MKIAMFVRHFWLDKLTSLPRTVFEISNNLIEKSNKVTIFTNQEHGYSGKIVLENGLIIRYLENFNKISSIEDNFNIFHFYGSLLGCIIFLSKIRTQKVVLNIYDYKFPFKDFFTIYFSDIFYDTKRLAPFFAKDFIGKLVPDFILKFLLKNSQKIVVNSNRSESFYNKILKNERKISNIPHGLNFSKFRYSNNKKIKKLRKKLGFSEEDKIVLYLGHAYLVRGIDDLIHSMNVVQREVPDAKLLLLLNKMPESPINHIKNLVSRHLKKDSVKLIIEYVKNVEVYYQMADIVVLPYRLSFELPEYPFVLLEAMASKKPIITTRIGAIPEIIKNNFNGILVSPKSKNELTDAILMLLENKTLSNKLGNNAKMTVKNFDWENVSNRIYKIYGGI